MSYQARKQGIIRGPNFGVIFDHVTVTPVVSDIRKITKQVVVLLGKEYGY